MELNKKIKSVKESIKLFNHRIELIQTNPLHNDVIFWTLYELEQNKNNLVDELHDLEIQLKLSKC